MGANCSWQQPTISKCSQYAPAMHAAGMEVVVEEASLSDLPEHVLLTIFRHLEASHIARVLVQDRRLRQVGSDQGLWQALAQKRWKLCSAAPYGNDWLQLYSVRAQLPVGLPGHLDLLHDLTLREQSQGPRYNSASLPPSPVALGSPVQMSAQGVVTRPYIRPRGMLFESVMEAVFGAGALAGRGTVLATCPDWQQYRRDMAWWLASKPEALFTFVRRMADALTSYDPYGGGYHGWADVPWRRSAAQYLLELGLGPQAGVCPSISDRLRRDLAAVDSSIRTMIAEGADLEVQREPGLDLPASHWWFHLKPGCGCSSSGGCSSSSSLAAGQGLSGARRPRAQRQLFPDA